jgi:hypothetical protein
MGIEAPCSPPEADRESSKCKVLIHYVVGRSLTPQQATGNALAGAFSRNVNVKPVACRILAFNAQQKSVSPQNRDGIKRDGHLSSGQTRDPTAKVWLTRCHLIAALDDLPRTRTL